VRRRRSLHGTRWAVCLALVLVGSGAAQVGRAATTPPVVTVFGDSVMDAVRSEPVAIQTLGEGVTLNLQIAPCRHLGQVSCPFNGERPPTVLQLIPELGPALGETVIVAVGYDDFADTYAQDIADAVVAFRAQGVKHILWLTLRASTDAYPAMNDAVRAAAVGNAGLTIVDWDLYSRDHPEWFQPDGIHLRGEGARAMATLVHEALVELGIPLTLPPPEPPAPVAKLGVARQAVPVAHVGSRYSVRLVARGGRAPYRWALRGGTLPRGVRLSADGRIRGVPRVAGRFRLTVGVVDANGTRAAGSFVLPVRAS
jgi:Putative Ig domain